MNPEVREETLAASLSSWISSTDLAIRARGSQLEEKSRDETSTPKKRTFNRKESRLFKHNTLSRGSDD